MVMVIWFAEYALGDRWRMFAPSSVLLGHKPAAVKSAWFATSVPTAQGQATPIPSAATAPR